MPDSPPTTFDPPCNDEKLNENNNHPVKDQSHSSDEDEIELVSQSKNSIKQDLKNNNDHQGLPNVSTDGVPTDSNPQNQHLIYPRPSAHLMQPTMNNLGQQQIIHPLLQPRLLHSGFAPNPLTFQGWLYRGLQPSASAVPPGYPLGRGHELMRRLCTINPAFAQSIIEDYIRPQVRT